MTSRLVDLREDGISNEAIADELGVTLGQLQTQIAKLIRDGVIRSRKGMLSSHLDAYVQGRERTPQSIARDLDALYSEGKSHLEIAEALSLTAAQVHNQLTARFAAGLTRRSPVGLTENEIRSMHAAYLAGESIEDLARGAGIKASSTRKRMRKLGLPIGRPTKKRAKRAGRSAGGAGA